MTQLGDSPKSSAILGMVSSNPAHTNITPITPIPNRAPAADAPAPNQLGSPKVDNNGRPIIPAIPLNTQNIQGVNQSASAMTSDGIINFVQDVRKEIVNSYLGAGVIPKGTADKLLLQSSLKDLVDTEFAKKKNESDAKLGASAATIAALFEALPKTQPGIAIPNSQPKSLPSDLPPATLVPGEADTEPPQMDIASFMSGTDPEAPKAPPETGKKPKRG